MKPPEMNALDLDKYLVDLTPEQREYAEALLTSSWKDQMDAAHDEVTDIIVASKGCRDISPVTPQTVPEWLRLAALAAFVQWMKGNVKTCQHVMSWRSPMPVLSAAWKPGLVACEYCAPTLFMVYGEADRTCDGCGHICDVEHGDLISTSTVIMGNFAYQAGVCMDCDYGPDDTNWDGNRRGVVRQ